MKNENEINVTEELHIEDKINPGILFSLEATAIIIMVIIENLIMHVSSFNMEMEAAFVIVSFHVVTFVTMLILCGYEDIEYAKFKKRGKINDNKPT